MTPTPLYLGSNIFAPQACIFAPQVCLNNGDDEDDDDDEEEEEKEEEAPVLDELGFGLGLVFDELGLRQVAATASFEESASDPASDSDSDSERFNIEISKSSTITSASD